MGISLSTARVIAPLSFAIDFAAQQYGMFASPNMKDVHDANLSFWSPQPFFIAGFFFPQQLFQLAWLWRLWSAGSGSGVPKGTGTTTAQADVAAMVDFTPFYTVGNLCIATWMIFWNRSMLKTSNIFVVINSLAQLYFIMSDRLPRMNLASTNSILTHVVAKTFAGIGILDLLHNGSVAYFNHDLEPGTAIKVLTALGFGGLAMGSDWIFGGCLVYDLIALGVGQNAYGNAAWSRMLFGYAAGTAAIVTAKNVMRPPYIRSAPGYTRLDEPTGGN